MFERTRRVKDMVREIYEDYPSTRGDDRLLIKRVLDRFFPQVKLTPIMFEALRSIPSFESIRRRSQELRVEHPEYQPTERVKQKRIRRASAFRNYYGTGKLKITDWM
jgi:hypothetical protein